MPRGKGKVTSGDSSKRGAKSARPRKFSPAKKVDKQTSPEDNRNVDKTVATSSKIADLKQFEYKGTNTPRQHVKIEFEPDSESPGPTSPVKQPKTDVLDVIMKDTKESKGLWEPPNWREFLVNLRNMRANNDAPVDSMGCHMSMDADAPPEVIRYQSLISLMLSSQTKDQVTFAAMERLRLRGLTVDNVLSMSDEELGKLIYPVGFWKTKVKYIKKTTETLKELYNSDIPDSVEKLCKLTGVGPKMAHICMKVAWNKVTGIGVDTHVHRISNRIGWVKKPTSTPEDTRKALQTWLPFDLWSEVNHLMVGFGQTICLPVGPMCHECLNNDICPSSNLGRKTPRKTPKKTPKKTPTKDVKEENVLQVKKELDLDMLGGKRKVTPKSKVAEYNLKVETIDIDSKSDTSTQTLDKITKKRKVTPKKTAVDPDEQLKENITGGKLSVKSELKEPDMPGGKRKVTPKSKVAEYNLKVETIDIDSKSDTSTQSSDKITQKRKVTPKKTVVDSDEQLKENITDGKLSVKSELKEPDMPGGKRKVTPKSKGADNNLKVDTIDIDSKSDTSTQSSDKITKKRKVTPKKTVVDSDEQLKENIDDGKLSVKSELKQPVKKKSPRSKPIKEEGVESNVETDNIKRKNNEQVTGNINDDKLDIKIEIVEPVKKKSPRIKKVKDVSEDFGNEVENKIKRNTRATKKVVLQ